MPHPATPLHDSATTDQALCAELLMAVDALSRRRADQLDDQTIDRFVRMGWLQWNGGSLRPTPVGARVCDAVLLAYA